MLEGVGGDGSRTRCTIIIDLPLTDVECGVRDMRKLMLMYLKQRTKIQLNTGKTTAQLRSWAVRYGAGKYFGAFHVRSNMSSETEQGGSCDERRSGERTLPKQARASVKLFTLLFFVSVARLAWL